MRRRLPNVQTDYLAFSGGLDLLTPAIALSPGKVFDAQNYEPQISGGYRRRDGFERFDGSAATPSAAVYWTLEYTLSGTIAVGDTITGATSGATGKVLSATTTLLILGRVTDGFESGENLEVVGVQGVATSSSIERGSALPADDAANNFLAANDRRADILAVPGSGMIRGVHVYKDTTYAFRDNAAGDEGCLYKSTTSGWEKIVFNNEISFNAVAAGIAVGNTITGGTSGATAPVLAVLLRIGTWTVAGKGTLVIGAVTNGPFQSGEALKVGGVTKATSTSLVTAITRLPGGVLDLVSANFTGSTETEQFFGADGVNTAFSFDGTTYVPIHTGMTVDTPSHIYEHKFHLFLSFWGSVQASSLTDNSNNIVMPYAWTVVTGASEIATGDEVTGFISNAGDLVSGATLHVLTRGELYTIYGSSVADFKIVRSIGDIGFFPFTAQLISNQAYGLTNRGIQAIVTTQAFGDFQYASVSHLIQPMITNKRGLETCSTTSRTRNQYRVFFSDGSAIVVGLTGDKDNGLMPLEYGMPVRCITTTTLSNGAEICFFGSDDGYIYQDNVGTSLDGEPIESWMRPAFNNLKSPQTRKSFKQAVFDIVSEGYGTVSITFDLGYGSPDVSPSGNNPDVTLRGSGGYWGQFTWDNFTWDSPVYLQPRIAINGTEKNISFLFYSNSAIDKSHTVTGCSVSYISRRLERTYTI